ncbi:YraN family protein [Candidatus Kuenenbacteria bacterium]|nr:YraN family protein [Candidatus Kuenenbacteria bacterium]
MNNREKGRRGEELAEKYLQENNYKVVEKNYYTRWGEIDIIARDRKTEELVFVEVKMRNSVACGLPEESVTEGKLEKLEMTAEVYRQEKAEDGRYRFDCLAIEGRGNNKDFRITHYKNIGLS